MLADNSYIPKISFCIPTFNRSAFIGECLDSILTQWRDDLEIVIVDGASTDETSAVVARYQALRPEIRYFRRETNVGVDADVLKSAELATGEFCWFISDDDRIEPDTVAYLIGTLERLGKIAGASVNYASYDATLSHRIYTAPAGVRGELRSDVVYTDRDSCFTGLGAHLGYLSAQIVDRRLWAKVVASHDLSAYMESAWILVYVIGLMLVERPRWGYLHRECVANRSANDSFITRVGGYRRQIIAHVTFDNVISGLFGRGPVRRDVFKSLIADRMPKNLASYKANGASLSLQGKLLRLYTRRYWSYPAFWWRVFPIFFLPNALLAGVRRAYLRLAANKH